jgi:hypothetical protein
MEKKMNSKQRLIFMLFFVLVLSACNSPAAAPREAAAETSAPADTSASAAPAEETMPSATATAAREELEILVYFGWIDELGDYRVEMLARNPYDYPVLIREVSYVKVLDSAGEQLVNADIYAGDGLVTSGLGLVLPGETIPASSCLTCSSPMASGEEYNEPLQALGDSWTNGISIGLLVEETDPIPYTTDFDVEVNNFYEELSEVYTMNGTVTYTGTEPIRAAFVRILVFDQDGNYAGWGEAWVAGELIYDEEGFGEFEIMSTGTTLPFQYVSIFTPVNDQPLDYEITVIARVEEE